MPGIFAGETPKFLIRVRDEAGVQLTPDDVDQIVEMKIWIFNEISGVVIAKLYLNTSPGTGWRQASVKEVTTGDKRVLFTLTADETNAAPVNQNSIQVEITIPDLDFEEGVRVIKKQGSFSEIKPAKT
jgi:hypothetical protein